MIHYFESFLYLISVALFYPVVIGLFLLTCWVVLYAGHFVGELFNRREKVSGNTDRFLKFAGADFKSRVQKSRYPDLEVLQTIRSWEEVRLKQLNRIRFVIRTGPSLGLMGTLIPMGTALSSLSQGDMLAMSSNMVTAFTTTIVGLGCGTVAYLISLAEGTWLRKEMQACEMYGEQLVLSLQEKVVDHVPEHEMDECLVN
ncbi:MAG: MotA/TolQ/ExbB proton channel family protein [Mangrovibacterium sp.]